MKISVLIPCHNEEKSIKKCVQSCLDQTRKPNQILVVNDGSTDSSLAILNSFGKKIETLNIYPATGNKSHAQEAGLAKISGDVFVATDGDTVLDPDFVRQIELEFQDPKISAVGGYVRSVRHNWLTACRAFEYTISQYVHKRAQNYLDFLYVIPGASGAFRTDLFKKYIRFDHDTVTEDLDFSYKLHTGGFKINYNRKAVVYTQDPYILHDYINQMRRWLGGGWQNLKKHFNLNLFSHPGRSLELSLIFIEGLVFSLLLYIIPLINLSFALQLWAGYLCVLMIEIVVAVFLEKRWDLFSVIVYYPLIAYINAAILIEQFVKVILFRKKNLVWFHPTRLAI